MTGSSQAGAGRPGASETRAVPNRSAQTILGSQGFQPFGDTFFSPTDLASTIPREIREGLFAAAILLRRDWDGDRGDCRIDLIDRDGAALFSFGPFPEDDSIALWLELHDTTSLELIAEREDGSREVIRPQIGCVDLGPIRIRRRHALLKDRRPRFLTKRKIGHFIGRPRLYRGKELFGRNV